MGQIGYITDSNKVLAMITKNVFSIDPSKKNLLAQTILKEPQKFCFVFPSEVEMRKESCKLVNNNHNRGIQQNSAVM